jgi:uncharacterized protein (DUF779 family)
MPNIERVLATAAACRLVDELRARHGELMFHQSGGCCDGSSPMCYEAGDFRTGDSDILLGDVCGVPFWMSRDQYAYWKHTELTLDVVPGRGSSFSIEIPTGFRFLIRSRVFSDAEWEALRDQPAPNR